jgi:RNA polymerase sigma factor (sigma-70 family)
MQDGGYKNPESGVALYEGQTFKHRKLLHKPKELELHRRWLDGDEKAGDALIEAHLRMVPKIAQRTAIEYGYKPGKDAPLESWDGYGQLCQELEAAGYEGLSLALYRFDPERGARFSTCAWWSIEKACREEAKWLRSPVKYPKRVPTLWSRSLDTPRRDKHGEDITLTPLNLVTDEAPARLPDLSALLDAKAALLTDPGERKIFRARYLTEQPQKLKDLAAELGISTGRVHQLERRAVKRLAACPPQQQHRNTEPVLSGQSAP